MPPRKKKTTGSANRNPSNVKVENAGLVLEQPITETLTTNYMPYAMSVIVSRAIPEIDGFKPSHRKLLYTMYKMGLLSGARVKSANAVGATMKLNPHGDAAIYETMVRMARSNESLLVPYVDSKGNFGKVYSRDMAYAASRYTEVKLEKVCQELFKDIDKDTVDFQDNYDNSMKEPTLLPTTFPAVLVNANTGIAVGMASSICPFNLKEVCETAIAFLKDADCDLFGTLHGPDFPGGGLLLYDEQALRTVYETGRGSLKVRARYSYEKKDNRIEVTEIPYTTTIEAIIDKVVDLIKSGKAREISDIRDESDLSGLKIAIDLKRGVDGDLLMQKLFRMTPLQDSFACNFNVLIAGTPRVMGVKELLTEWTAFRTECIKRGVYYDLCKKKEKLHLLKGLQKILLDIDKAVRIVRDTEEDREVIPNLMVGFGIDEIQAEYVADIKLRHLNKEYILNRTAETNALRDEIDDMQDILERPARVRKLMIDDLKRVADSYGKDRKTQLLTAEEAEEAEILLDETPDYPVHLFFTQEGYFKKITPASLRMSAEHKLKDGDRISKAVEATNRTELIFLTNLGQAYKTKASEFEDTKASAMGDYIPAKLGMDTERGERAVLMITTADYKGNVVLFFENGKAARFPLSQYETKTNRKKLVGALSVDSPLVAGFVETEPEELCMISSSLKLLIVNTALISLKQTKATKGVQLMTLRKKAIVTDVLPKEQVQLANEHRYRSKNLPAAGTTFSEEDLGRQLSLTE